VGTFGRQRARCLVGLVGAGIGGSLTPALHEREGDRQGLRYLYQLIDFRELGLTVDDLGDVLRHARLMGYRGLNVTHPYKQAAVPHLDELAPDAAPLGAVNTVVFEAGKAVGHNTDAYGFSRSFARGLPGARRARVVLLGAGGAGSAVAHAMLTLGAGNLSAVDVDPARAEVLVEGLRRRFGAERAAITEPSRLPGQLAEADGLVNATPVGMVANPGLPLAPELLRPELWVADLVYRPLETELLRRARAAGCSTLDGGGMAVFQAAQTFRKFTGIEPDEARMLHHFAALASGTSPGDPELDQGLEAAC
jgi:shikimate dehydrogenase